ncbi:MAG: 50S ribosomal protein L30e [archaeon]
MDISAGIKRIMATGKIEYGSKKTLENIRSGKAKAVIIADNAPAGLRADIEQYAKISETPVVVFDGTSLELGRVCGKPFVVTSIAVTNAGDVKIKELTGEKK